MISDDLTPTPYYIVGFGGTQDCITDVKVIIEKETVVSFSNCFATYYIFNISYPSDFKAIMLMQETQVYGLKSSSNESRTLTVFKDSLQTFCDEIINNEQ